MKLSCVFLIAVNACSWGRDKDTSRDTWGKIRNRTTSAVEYIESESPALWNQIKNATADTVDVVQEKTREGWQVIRNKTEEMIEDMKAPGQEISENVSVKNISIATKSKNDTLDPSEYGENRAKRIPWKTIGMKLGYSLAGLLIGALVGVFFLLGVGVALTLLGFTVDGVLALSFAAMCQSYCYGAATGSTKIYVRSLLIIYYSLQVVVFQLHNRLELLDFRQLLSSLTLLLVEF